MAHPPLDAIDALFLSPQRVEQRSATAPLSDLSYDPYGEMLHQTSSFDCVVRRHNPNAYLSNLPVKKRKPVSLAPLDRSSTTCSTPTRLSSPALSLQHSRHGSFHSDSGGQPLGRLQPSFGSFRGPSTALAASSPIPNISFVDASDQGGGQSGVSFLTDVVLENSSFHSPKAPVAFGDLLAAMQVPQAVKSIMASEPVKGIMASEPMKAVTPTKKYQERDTLLVEASSPSAIARLSPHGKKEAKVRSEGHQTDWRLNLSANESGHFAMSPHRNSPTRSIITPQLSVERSPGHRRGIPEAPTRLVTVPPDSQTIEAHENSSVFVPFNRLRPRTILRETLPWSLDYTNDRRQRELLDADDIEEALQQECEAWHTEYPSLQEYESLKCVENRKWIANRPGDNIAVKLEEKTQRTNSMFLTKVRQYMAQVEVMVEKENEDQKKLAAIAAVERQKQLEWEAANPFADGGVLDKTFGNIATVEEQKFNTLATRYYNIARRNLQRDIDLKEQYVVKMEHTTYKLGSVMTYDEFVVVYRQFHRYADPNPFLTIAQIPKNGWIFVDKVIKQLITRKIDKHKTGKIPLLDLCKHLFPAMSFEELEGLIPKLEEQYLTFSDKTVRMFLDRVDVDKVNHFGMVFSLVDKEGRGRVFRDEFVNNMPIDKESAEDEEEIRFFLGELFDRHARRDMNDKLEFIGEYYFDVNCMAEGLSVGRYNQYSGTVMGH